MKEKKIVLGLVAVLFTSLVLGQAIAVARADPALGLIVANKRKHIVRDPLVNSAGATSGWVTFACQSLEGFQYSVAVKGLAPGTCYTVRALSLALMTEPAPLPTSDGPGVTYSLGHIHTNGDGEGEVTGLISLPAWNTALGAPVGLYNWVIEVVGESGPVLSSPSYDTVEFVVFSSWP